MVPLFLGGEARAVEPWTLERVIAEARAANARLPVARTDVELGAASVREAHAAFGPKVSVGGDLRYAPPGASYNAAVAPIDEERLQIQAAQPLYDGGALRARLHGSEAGLRSAQARYRVAERELELEVRSRFFEATAAGSELVARQRGLDRLRAYLALVRDLRAAGQGSASDLLRTQARVATEEANVTDAERRVADAKLELNDLMGRDPSAPLELAPLPAPSPPARAADDPWRATPDVAQAEAARAVQDAAIAEAKAARLPHLDLAFDGGIFGPGFPFPGSSPSLPARFRDDTGVSVALEFTWNLWDLGVYQARLARARLQADQARATVVVTSRAARLSWERAQADLASLYETIQIRSRAVPTARDSYVLAESLYRGGAGTALEVLDAHAALVDAEIAEATSLRQYRTAAARALRWGNE